MHKRYPFSSSFISAGRQVQRVAQKKKPRIFPPRCFLLASSWSMMPPEVVSTTNPNCLLGRRLLVHFSMSLMATSNLGEMTPHLLSLPVRLMTILPALWSSTTSNSPMYPCFIMTVRNLMTTLEQGLMRTCLLPLFSALLMHLRASASEFIRTMLICFNFSLVEVNQAIL